MKLDGNLAAVRRFHTQGNRYRLDLFLRRVVGAGPTGLFRSVARGEVSEHGQKCGVTGH